MMMRVLYGGSLLGVLQGIGGWGRSWKSPRGFALSRLCKRRDIGGGGMGGGCHLLVDEGRGTEVGARRGEKEGLAGAVI